jgi:integrase
MKHFIQIKAPKNRPEMYLLLTKEGNEFRPFSITMKNMARQEYTQNTINQYAGHIARFIDYIYEASKHTDAVTPEFVLDVVYGYKDFLLFGVDAEDELTVKIAVELRPNRTTSGASLQPIGSAIKYFLTLSDAKSLVENEETLFSKITLPKLQRLTAAQQAQMKQTSMLASVIRGGTQFTKKSGSIFGNYKKTTSSYKRLPMPFDKTSELIRVCRSYRDKALYSLLAASGCRIHEALQLRFCDINLEERSVFLIDPFQRDNGGLTPEEYNQLAWKGRATEETFLIEPFKTLFFEHLVSYIKKERIAHGKHDFIFQNKDGRPYFTTTRQTRTGAFRKLRDKIGLAGVMEITVHSLRHAYGFYTLNYLPLAGQFGLPISIVKLLMGHANLASTELYAKHDKELVKTKN